MELNITRFFRDAAPRDYSASQAELGVTAGADTWRAACDDSADWPLLDDDEKRDAFRAFVRSSGGWSAEEIAAWSDAELNALCIQWIAGDMREAGFDDCTSPDAWTQYEKDCEEGNAAGRIWQGNAEHAGEVFFYIGD